MLAGGDTVELLSADPTLTRHQSGNRGGVGEQNLSPISEGDLGAGDGDLSDFHGGLPELRSV